MIDFIRIHYKDKDGLEDWIERKEHFKWIKQELDTKSGEISPYKKTNYFGFRISIGKKTGYVKNSIHKSENLKEFNEEHNWDQFSFSRLEKGIQFYDTKILEFANTPITQLEFGLNIKIGSKAEDVILKNIIAHKGQVHNHDENYGGRGKLKQFDHSNYVIKVYDKAKQFNLPYNLLRFEIKFLNAKDIRRLGIYCMNDLLEKPRLEALFDLLIKRFDEMDILDEIPRNGTIPKGVLRDLDRYYNPQYWAVDVKKLSRKTQNLRRRRFKMILNQYNLLKTKAVLRLALKSEFEYLINH